MLTLNRYTKAIVMAIVPLIAALGIWQQSGKVDAAEISLLVLALFGALVVALARNLSAGWRRFAKFFVGASASLVTTLTTALITGAWTSAEWTTLVTGFLTACLLWFVQNADEGGTPGRASHSVITDDG